MTMNKYRIKLSRRIRASGREIAAGSVVEVSAAVAFEMVSSRTGEVTDPDDLLRLHRWVESKARAGTKQPGVVHYR
jgi:hypothetical protein